MAARTRTSRPSAPAGPRWDEVELAPLVLVRGPEAVLADRAVDRLLTQARAQDPATEVTRVGAATYEPHQLDSLVSPSLFGEPRVVLVPDLEQMNEALLADLLAYVPHPQPDVAVILRHNVGQRGKKLLDAVAASPYPVVTCEQVKYARDKAALVTEDVRRARRSIEPAAVAALVDALGSDLRELCAAVEQLLADTQGQVTAEQVRTYYAGRIEATGFMVADAAVCGDVGGAITALRHAVATGSEPVQIVSALASKVRQLAQVTAPAGQRQAMPSWQAERARKELRSWSDEGLAAAIVAIADADVAVKGGSRDAVYACEKAVLEVCRARRLGRQR